MIKTIQHFFERYTRLAPNVTSGKVLESHLQLATVALLIEACKADHKIKEEERKIITEAVRKAFSLSDKETMELICMAEEEVREAVSLYQFTRLVDKGFSYEQKKNIIELMWRVVFADLEMERHEEYLVRRVANLLHVSHSDFIETKLKSRDNK